MSKIRCYVSHSIRGKFGKDATVEQMNTNNQKAIDFGVRIKAEFPGVDFYVPGDHDEFITIAFVNGYINEEQILAVDCEIIDRCNLLINFVPDEYLSTGMMIENIHAGKRGIPIFNVHSDNMNGAPIRVIDQYILGLMKG